MEGSDQSNPCAICLGGMGAGGGQAIFTAECSHTFHFHCISASVAHGNLVCPLCNARWRELPSVGTAQAPPAPVPRTLLRPRPEPMHHVQPLPIHWPLPHVQPQEPQVFDDDEPVDVQPPAGDGGQRQAARSGGETLAVTTHTEYSAVASNSSRDNFAVLVHVKAPGMADADAAAAAGSDAPRAPLDLVTVLDVSGSMAGAKLALLKQAMGFVIDNLGPHDRLSVVSFSSGARRDARLLRMSGDGKATAKAAVESLVARGGTNIAAGLRTAAKVLDERRHRNTVSSVILLSDGQDTYTTPRWSRGGGAAAPNYEALVPPSFMATGTTTAPIHTFGFGNDHDAAAMHVIAEATAGTFSYIENEAVIQDAFAQCIGGLLTVVVQEARVAVACGDPGVRIGSVRSGRYESRVGEDGRSASIAVGELYADEERRFLLFLSVPAVEATDGETALVKVNCSYRDTAGGARVDVTAADTVVARPEQVVVDAERSTEVERERVRVEATEDIAAARAAAERGAHQEAVEILESSRRAVAQSEAALGGDATILALAAELHEMRRVVSNTNSYDRSGRAFMLSGMSRHMQQRANMESAVFFLSSAGPVNQAAEAATFATPAMRAMLLRSRIAREESSVQQQRPSKSDASNEAESSAPEPKV